MFATRWWLANLSPEENQDIICHQSIPKGHFPDLPSTLWNCIQLGKATASRQTSSSFRCELWSLWCAERCLGNMDIHWLGCLKAVTSAPSKARPLCISNVTNLILLTQFAWNWCMMNAKMNKVLLLWTRFSTFWCRALARARKACSVADTG